MNVEQRLVDALRSGDQVEASPDLWTRVVHSIEEDQAHRRKVATSTAAVIGVLTAGDLTRRMEAGPDFLDVPVSEVMTANPKMAKATELGSAAVHRMEEHGIMALPVEDDEGHLVGIVHLHDLMRSGAV